MPPKKKKAPPVSFKPIRVVLSELDIFAKGAMVIATLISVLVTATAPAMMWAMTTFLGDTAGEAAFDAFADLATFCFGLGAFQAIASATRMGCLAFFSRTCALKFGVTYFAATIGQPISWFDSRHLVELPHEIVTDLDSIVAPLGLPLMTMMANWGTVCCGVVACLFFCWPIAVLLFLLVPLHITSMRLVAKGSWKVMMATAKENRLAAGAADECLSGVSTVLAHGGEEKEIARYSEYLDKMHQNALQAAGLMAFSSGGMSTVNKFMMYSGFVAGAYMYQERVTNWLTGKPYTAVELIIPIMMSQVLIAPLSALTSSSQVLVQSVQAANKLLALQQRAKQLEDEEKSKADIDRLESVTMEDVHFAYPAQSQAKVLQGISMKLEQSKFYALVGESGSGKSTVMNILMRFYDPNGGQVLVNNQGLSQTKISSFRSLCGFVPQEPVLFTVSIQANIAMGSGGKATQSDVQKICDMVKITEFTDKLPEGLETICSASHSNLSGGQRQRIALARALIGSPQLLLLDEATSALDSKSETDILSAIKSFKAKMRRNHLIVLAIAHRLTSIWDSDMIFVLSDGVIMEEGTHESLQDNKEGVYATLVRIQQVHGLPQRKVQPTSLTRGLTAKELRAAEMKTRSRLFVGGQSQLRLGWSTTKSASNNPNSAARSFRPDLSFTAKSTSMVSSGALSVFNATADDKTEDGNKTKEAHSRSLKEYERKATSRIYDYALPSLKRSYYQTNLVMVARSILVPLMSGLALPLLLVTFFTTRREEVVVAIATRGLVLVGMAVIQVLLDAKAVYVAIWLNYSCLFGIRTAVYRHILRQPVSFHDSPETAPSVMVDMILRQSQAIPGVLRKRSLVFYKVPLLFWLFGVAFVLNYLLGLALLALAPLVLVSTWMVASAGIKASEYGQITGQPFQVISDALQNPRVVQAAQLQEGLIRLFRLRSLESESDRNQAGLRIGLQAAFQGVSPCCNGLYFLLSGALIDAGLTSVFAVQACFLLMIFATTLYGAYDRLAPDGEKGKEAWLQLLAVLDTNPAINGLEPTGVIASDLRAGTIRFRQVSFFYASQPSVLVLRKMTFHVHSGSRVGVVGPSGCGKSTMFSLLQRKTDPTHGDILIGEQALPLRLMNVRWWRRQVAIVDQEPILFRGTVKFNVTYGLTDEEVSDELLERCKDLACLSFLDQQTRHSSLSSDALDEAQRLGWDTPVGSKGDALSGGQRQRVALCRAFVRQSSVVLLDEATSALDLRTEEKIITSIKEHCGAAKDRTVLAIAHRTSTIVDSDVLLVVQRGMIAEKGSHTQLLQTGTLYNDLLKGAIR